MTWDPAQGRAHESESADVKYVTTTNLQLSVRSGNTTAALKLTPKLPRAVTRDPSLLTNSVVKHLQGFFNPQITSGISLTTYFPVKGTEALDPGDSDAGWAWKARGVQPRTA